MLGYTISLSHDDNDTILVTCPAFPEVTTFGSDRTDARRRAVDAIDEAIAGRIADNASVPKPQRRSLRRKQDQSWVTLPALALLKTQLYIALRESDTSRAELARRLGWGREQVDRLFRLDHQSRIDQIEQALHALHRRVDVEVKKCDNVKECV
jgi:antitoxin HicB